MTWTCKQSDSAPGLFSKKTLERQCGALKFSWARCQDEEKREVGTMKIPSPWNYWEGSSRRG